MARQLEYFPNLVTMFLTRVREKGDAPFLWAKRGGAWQSVSWKEAARQTPHEALKTCYRKRADRCLIMMAWAKNGSREPGLPEASTS